jgi:hypothetical protein
MVSRSTIGRRHGLLALLFAQLLVAHEALALPNDAAVPILLYHSSAAGNTLEVTGNPETDGCRYEMVAAKALRSDLEEIHAQGFTVVPAHWIAEWALGLRDGSTLPAKVVGITIDDGYNLDWWSNTPERYPTWCPEAISIREVLQEFKAAHSDLPAYSPHVSSFVIASPVARTAISTVNGLQYATDDWWATAQSSGLMSIYNHSADHDHGTLTAPQWDGCLGFYVPVRSAFPDLPSLKAGPGGCTVPVPSGYSDKGLGDFCYVGTDTGANLSAERQVVKAAEYIESRTHVWPDLFAYPFGHNSAQLRAWFENNPTQHRTLAAFSTNPQPVRRGTPRYAMGRFTHGGDWKTAAQFKALLASHQPDPTANWSVDGVTMVPGQSINVTTGQPLTLAYTSTTTNACEMWVTKDALSGQQLWPAPPQRLQTGPSYTFAPQAVDAPGTYYWHVKCYSPYAGKEVETWLRGVATAPAPTATWYINGSPMPDGGAFGIYAGQLFGLRWESTSTQRCEHWVTAGYSFYPELWRAPAGSSATLPSFDYGYVSVDAPGVYNWHVTCYSANDASSVSTWVRGYVY